MMPRLPGMQGTRDSASYSENRGLDPAPRGWVRHRTATEGVGSGPYLVQQIWVEIRVAGVTGWLAAKYFFSSSVL
jgi:hypothetical protein